MKIKDLPKHLRPREKLIDKGPENITDKDLLAILLRTGRSGKSALDIAADLLRKHPLHRLLDVSFEDLKKIKGLDQGKICTLLASFELTKRALRTYENSLPFVATPNEALIHIADIANLKREHFVVLYLNARHQLIHKETISIGTLTASLVHPREVFAPALELRAASVILAHNHPSDDPEPSDDDITITMRIMEAGELLGVELLDHIIVSKSGHCSLKQDAYV